MKKQHKIKQIDKFKQTARELQTDDDESRFDEKLTEIARHKPVDRRPKPADEESD
jgi:hypothetical protein